MLNEDLSESMKKQVKKIVEKIGKESTVSNITMTFTSPKFPEYKVYLCREIDTLTIHQDFVQNYADKITAELRMERDPYIGLLYMRKNLNCKLQITFTKPDEVLDDKQYSRKPDYELDFKCILTKFEDLFKKMSTEQLFPTKRRENDNDRKTFLMSIELIADDVYKARKESLYFTGRDTTMYDMMRYCANYFGYKKALLYKPDNDRKYSNFVIPPSYGIESIFSFLQVGASLGMYKDGLISYIMNGMLFVYPRFGNPVNKLPIHVYCLGGNKFAGLNRMDWEEGPQKSPIASCKYPLHILSPSSLNEINWTNLGSENEPTAICAQMSDLVIDATRRLVNDKKTVLEHRTRTLGVVPPDVMDYDNFIRVRHVKSEGNMFKFESELRAYQGRTIKFKWEQARPWCFHPATEVTIHYDDHSKMEEAKGIAEVVDYVMTKDQTNRMFPRWTCVANVEVNCSVREEGLLQSKR